jgi:hypothetical protein
MIATGGVPWRIEKVPPLLLFDVTEVRYLAWRSGSPLLKR